jgi:hypothetical protein
MFWVATPCSLERELEISELHIIFIFRAETVRQARNWKKATGKLSLLSDHEDGGHVFLQKSAFS